MMSEYEDFQKFNFITRALHSIRYKNLKIIVRRISKEKRKLNIVDIGCGPAKVYKVLSQMNINFNYLGIEIRTDFVKLAEDRYSHNGNFNIINNSVENVHNSFDDADLIIGLETFEHIPETIVVRTIEAITQSNCKYFYITVPNEIGPAIFLKNVGSYLMGYQRYKEYSWRETLAATLYNLDKVKRHGTKHKGFDWRWLAQTLRQNCKILRYTTSPVNFVPKFLSPSIGFVCCNDKHNGLI